MTLKELERNWTVSSYNEDTEDQLDYYIKPRYSAVGDNAYLYSHEERELTRMEIIHIIRRMDDPILYDYLVENEDVLLDGEDEFNADTSAEFIMDNDCYLVWFKYVE